MNHPGVTLALGGGGARGVTHLGVIEVLESAGIPIERIVGVSIGSLLGAVYAFEPDSEAVQRKIIAFVQSPGFQQYQQALYGTRQNGDGHALPGFSWFGRIMDYLRANRAFHRVILKHSLLPGKVLEGIVSSLLPDRDIADTRIPMAIVAVDLASGHRVVLERGPLRRAVRGSASLPGIFPPVRLDGKLLCDIGVFYAVPAKIARYYRPDLVVAVDVTMDLEPYVDLGNALDTMMRMQDIGGQLLREETICAADVVVRPEVGGVEWMDFSHIEDLIEEGRRAARERLPEIRKRLAALATETHSPRPVP